MENEVNVPGEAAVLPESASGTTILKVMTINVRHNKDWWEERFPLIADEIVRLQPDVIGVQEMNIGTKQTRALQRLIEERVPDGSLKYYVYEHLKTGSQMMAGEGISILSRYPIIKKSFEDLGWGRPVVFAGFEPSPGLQVAFFNTHLHNKGGTETHRTQVETMLKFIGGMEEGAKAVFLTGDMNSYEESPEMGMIRDAGFIDTWRAFHGKKAMPAGATSPVVLMKNNPPQKQIQRIDFIYAKPGPGAAAELKIIDSVVCFKNFNADGLYPSDHLGVMTTFEIKH